MAAENKNAATTTDPCTFAEVQKAEQDQAKCRARGECIGLAFSGGGIRSATFNLGILQRLCELKLLGRFDYLSTISGGGYIGSWLTALIRREGNGDIRNIETQLPSKDDYGLEHPAIRFLRGFSNYLTPKLGLFSGDFLTAVATYTRNLTLNLSILIPLLAAVLVVPAHALFGFGITLREADNFNSIFDYGKFFLLLSSITVIAPNLLYRPEYDPQMKRRWFVQGWVVAWFVVAPATLVAWMGSYYLLGAAQENTQDWYWVAYTAVAYVVLWGIGLLIGALILRFDGSTQKAGDQKQGSPRESMGWYVKFIVFAIVAGALGGALFKWLADVMQKLDSIDSAWALALVSAFGTPLIVMCFLTVVVFHIGLTGRGFSEQQREWWSRLGGMFVAVLIGWTTVFSLALFGPAALTWTNEWIYGLGVGWLATTAGGVLAGRSATTGVPESKTWIEALTKVAPYVFVIGLLLMLSFGVYAGLKTIGKSDWFNFDYAACKCGLDKDDGTGQQELYLHAIPKAGEPVTTALALPPSGSKFSEIAVQQFCVMSKWSSKSHWLILIAAVLFGLAAVLSWRFNVNLFSLHQFYRNRLTRCYLGATNAKRRPHPLTGFDPEDDLEFCRLVQKPYHIVGVAINLMRGRQLAWQTRKAASFVFTPLYSGYEPAGRFVEGGFRKTSEYAVDPQGISLQLGTAITVSGAAASPNAGYHTSPAVAFLLTVFNVRLGRWCGDPKHDNAWRKRDPVLGLRYWKAELLGSADQDYPFINLSDGGHFENLGIYELVRRRCKTIVVGDASADKEFVFDDLADAIRKCYTDFGVRIEINVEDIRPNRETQRSARNFQIGTIHYEELDAAAKPGALIYIKASLPRDNLPTDLLHYKSAHPDFPHESTADQWFDEQQFESYRKLGYEVAKMVFPQDAQGDPTGLPLQSLQ
jgi:hypothetical protein